MTVNTNQDKEMNVVGHLTELRNRIIITAICFVVFFIIGFVFVKDIYGFIRKGMDFDLIITAPQEIIWIFLTIAAIIAIVGTLPVFSLQLWLFIKPGLTENEKKASLSYIPAVFLLFVIGLGFGYFVFNQFILPFLITLNEDMFIQLFTAEKYFKFMIQIVLIFAILFEIPVIVMFLTSLGIITPDFLRKVRKYAYFILLILGALVTPPDIFLQLIVAGPLFILYEISIYFSKIVHRRRMKKQNESMNNNS